MARPVVIDRNHILDSAESVLRSEGIAGLTFAKVALAAGISKGGLQAAFGTKEQLINAIYSRWCDEYDSLLIELVGPSPSPDRAMHGHIEMTRMTDDAEADRSAGLLTALLRSPDLREANRVWYRKRFELSDASTPEGRDARLAFLATEGTFMLRSLGLMNISDSEWQSIFDDIAALNSGEA
jgi:AcrR family transcriptional regulator